MILRVPDYFSQFHCLASACPQNCCIGWEVVVDDDTAAKFERVEGPFGDRLRAGLTREDGECCFVRKNRRCPFLNAQNLCEVHQTLGPEYTSKTCQTHPRFTEDYGALRETSLSASCPMAAGLLLGSRDPLRFSETQTPEILPWSDDWVPSLLACRDTAIAILQDRTRPWSQRAAWFLLLVNEAQSLLDDDRAEELLNLCEDFSALPEEMPEELLPEGGGIFPHALEFLNGLEILEPDWPTLLNTAKTTGAQLPDWMKERISCYFVFRYFLRNVNDGDLLSRAEFAVFSTLCVERLTPAAASPEQALSRYCREEEHDAENLAALQTAFCRDPQLNLASFFEELARN